MINEPKVMNWRRLIRGSWGQQILVATLAIGVVAWLFHFSIVDPLPFYSYFHDPELTYVFNSLMLKEVGQVSHTDHPGTALQLMGAGIHVMLANETEALFQPDRIDLFRMVWRVIGLVAALGFVTMIGVVTRTVFGFAVGVLILLSEPNFFIYWATFTPESAFFVLYLPVALLFIYLRYSKPVGDQWWFAALTGLVLGFLTTIKLTLWPVTLFLAMLVAISGHGLSRVSLLRAILFLSIATVTYLVIGSIFAENRQEQLSWLSSLIWNSGRYGSEISGGMFLSPGDIARHVQQGYALQDYLTAVLQLGLAAFGLAEIWRGRRGSPTRILAMAFLIALALQWVIFIKHPYQIKYMLSATIIFVCYWCARNALSPVNCPRKVAWFIPALMMPMVLNAMATHWLLHQFSKERNHQVVPIVNEALQGLNPEHTFFSYEIQHPLAALAFAADHTSLVHDMAQRHSYSPQWFRERNARYQLGEPDALPLETLPASLIFTSGLFKDDRAKLVYWDPDIGLGLAIYYVEPRSALPPSAQ